MISFSISDEMVLLGSQKLYYKNGVKMVSEQNEKAENLELSRLIKILGVLITYIRTPLMSGIRLARNRIGAKFATEVFYLFRKYDIIVKNEFDLC